MGERLQRPLSRPSEDQIAARCTNGRFGEPQCNIAARREGRHWAVRTHFEQMDEGPSGERVP